MGNYKIEKTPATDMVPSNLLTNTSSNLPPRVILLFLQEKIYFFIKNGPHFDLLVNSCSLPDGSIYRTLKIKYVCS